MIKLIILSLLGKKIVSSRILFNSIKSYLIFYLLILPAFLSARGLKTEALPSYDVPVSVSDEVANAIAVPVFFPAMDQFMASGQESSLTRENFCPTVACQLRQFRAGE